MSEQPARFDVVASAPGPEPTVSAVVAEAGWSVAIVEAGPFGGTCLNRGCIPSKMLVHVADVARTISRRSAGRRGGRGRLGRFTEVFRRRFDVAIGTSVARTRTEEGSVVLELAGDDPRGELRVDALLVATGRVPNTDRLATAAGLELDDEGFIQTDEYLRTNVDGVWALGDIVASISSSTAPTSRPPTSRTTC